MKNRIFSLSFKKNHVEVCDVKTFRQESCFMFNFIQGHVFNKAWHHT